MIKVAKPKIVSAGGHLSGGQPRGLLRPRCRGRRRVWRKRWSHRERELGECCREPERWWDVGDEFVVAAAEALHEGMTGGDPRGRPELFQPAHRLQPRLQPSMIAFAGEEP